MEQIILPSVTEKKIDTHTSRFTISPLFPGYGHTVGNGLRRVLLSSLPGAAVTSVKIDGADHEFTTVPGVKEDVVELLLNIKSLRVQMHDTNEPVTLLLRAKGPGTVTAKDFEANSKVNIANPDLYLATLSGKSTLSLEVTVEYGRGYDPVEKREVRSNTLGVISVDSLYTPVQGVSIEVENTRVGKMTNYDELSLTVATDGSISPAEALRASSAIMVDQFSLLASFGEVKAEEMQGKSEEDHTQSADELISAGLPVRVAKILQDNGVSNLNQLKAVSDDDLRSFSGLGPKAISEIEKIRQ